MPAVLKLTDELLVTFFDTHPTMYVRDTAGNVSITWSTTEKCENPQPGQTSGGSHRAPGWRAFGPDTPGYALTQRLSDRTIDVSDYTFARFAVQEGICKLVEFRKPNGEGARLPAEAPASTDIQ